MYSPRPRPMTKMPNDLTVWRWMIVMFQSEIKRGWLWKAFQNQWQTNHYFESKLFHAVPPPPPGSNLLDIASSSLQILDEIIHPIQGQALGLQTFPWQAPSLRWRVAFREHVGCWGTGYGHVLRPGLPQLVQLINIVTDNRANLGLW